MGILEGGWRGGWKSPVNAGWQDGRQSVRLSSREGRKDTPHHRSRGEALVRLSIPNVLRCLEFFFPDRRYLCRAARGRFPIFLRGEKLRYRNCRG